MAPRSLGLTSVIPLIFERPPKIVQAPPDANAFEKSLLLDFLDEFDFVTEHPYSMVIGGMDKTKHINIGDSALRTALAGTIFALKGNVDTSKRFLRTLIMNGWQAKEPVRHPNWFVEERNKAVRGGLGGDELDARLRSNRYSNDPYIMQLAFCTIASAWSPGADDDQRLLSKALMSQFIALFQRENNRFGSARSTDTTLLPTAQLVTRRVALMLNIDYPNGLMFDQLDAFLAGQLAQVIDIIVSERKNEWIEAVRSKLKDFKILGQSLSMDVRERIASAAVNAAIDALKGMKRALDLGGIAHQIRGATVDLIPRLARDKINRIVDEMMSAMGLNDLDFMMFGVYVRFKAHSVRTSGNDVDEYYSVHLMFWMLLTLRICATTLYERYVQWAASDLWKACEKHGMMLLAWLDGERYSCKKFLAEWKPEYNWVNNWFMQDIAGQRKAIDSHDEYCPRLDYLSLDSLLNRR